MPAHRIPTAVLARRGTFKKNPSRRAARGNEPLPNGPIGPPPACLKGKVLACWHELSGNAPAGVLTKADRLILELAARLLATVRASGAPQAALSQQLRACLVSMGMTPVDRARVNTGPAEAPASAWDSIDRPN